jgi:RND family efflux transporter MFP subunit
MKQLVHKLKPKSRIFATLLLSSLLVSYSLFAETIAAAAQESTSSVSVQLAPLTKSTLATKLTGYGAVTASPGQETSIALPRAGRVARLVVLPGQQVNRGDLLFEFTTAPADNLSYQQANTAVTYAREELKRNEALFEQQLITSSQLAAAKKSLVDTEASLQALNRISAGISVDKVTAPYAGIVTTIASAQGDFLAAGTAILKLARQGELNVQIGIEPEQIQRLNIGMPVSITTLFDQAQAIPSKIVAIHALINPQTRLVDIVLKLGPARANLLLGSRVRGDILLPTANSWVVPRSAVLNDANGSYVFQVRVGKAKRIAVTRGVDDGQRIAVTGSLDSRLPVVALGNYELEDGMAIREVHP